MLVTMKEILDRASRENYAVAAPNVSNELNARASIEAAEDMQAPLILDVAYRAAVDILFLGDMLRKLAEQTSIPVAINLDHGSSLNEVQMAIRAGFTSVMIDRSSCSEQENVRDVSEVVRVAHAVGISVEAELGHVGRADQYDRDRDAALTDPQAAKRFVEQTGIDCLAVAVGTAHGAYPKEFVPYLDFERLVRIKEATEHFPLVLHGSSGTDNESLRKACQRGTNKENINTDLVWATIHAVQATEFHNRNAFLFYPTIQRGFCDKLKEMIEVYGSAGKAWNPDCTRRLPRQRF